MMLKRRFSIFLIVFLALIAASSVSAMQVTKQLAPGVTLYQEINTNPGCELIVNMVTVDPKEAGVSVKAALGSDVVSGTDASKGREVVSAVVARKGALVGINADFFPFTGDPLGICISGGELISEPAGEVRAAVALTNNKTVIFDKPRLSAKLTLATGVSRQVDGINRPRQTNQVILYTETYGASTMGKFKGVDIVMTTEDLPVKVGKPITGVVSEVKMDSLDTAIPKGGLVLSAGGPAAWFLKENLKPGDTISFLFDIKSLSDYDWTQVEEAVGGGPWLIKDCADFVDAEAQGFNAAFSANKHPRTAVGATADGKLLLVTVDGRQPISKGVTLNELAALMRRLGAVNAINLDGGGSTTMSVMGLVVNSPSEAIQRSVANALLVFSEKKQLEELDNLAISGIESDVVTGQGMQLFPIWGKDDPQMLAENQLDSVVWGTTRGAGFVNQKGYYTPTIKPRKGTVNAIYGTQRANLEVNIVEPPPVEPVPAEPAIPQTPPETAPQPVAAPVGG